MNFPTTDVYMFALIITTTANCGAWSQEHDYTYYRYIYNHSQECRNQHYQYYLCPNQTQK